MNKTASVGLSVDKIKEEISNFSGDTAEVRMDVQVNEHVTWKYGLRIQIIESYSYHTNGTVDRQCPSTVLCCSTNLLYLWLIFKILNYPASFPHLYFMHGFFISVEIESK